MRRTLLLLGVASLAVANVASMPSARGAGALTPTTVLFDSNRTENWEIFAADGGAVSQLTDDDRFDAWWPKISPDRASILFYRTPKGVHDRDFAQTSLWVMDSDGANERQLLAPGSHGWAMHGHAEWSPDGTRLVMFGGPRHSPQIFVTAADGSNPVAVTARPGTNLDPSWSPDGASILFVGCPSAVCMPSNYEVYRMSAAPASPSKTYERLTVDGARDHDPYYSPDGSTIAWLRLALTWGIVRMPATGGSPQPVINDVAVSSKPGWSLDSQWIYFHRLALGRSSFNIFKIRPDGTGLTELEPRPLIGFGPYANEYPVNSSF
jgi:TolB protein